MRGTILGLLAAVVALACCGVAQAGDDWDRVASLTAGGDAKEVAINKGAKHILIKVKEGEVVINTVVVREGGNKTPYTVARKIAAGDHHIIDLPAKIMVSGLRISDAGRGAYEVHVRR